MTDAGVTKNPQLTEDFLVLAQVTTGFLSTSLPVGLRDVDWEKSVWDSECSIKAQLPLRVRSKDNPFKSKQISDADDTREERSRRIPLKRNQRENRHGGCARTLIEAQASEGGFFRVRPL